MPRKKPDKKAEDNLMRQIDEIRRNTVVKVYNDELEFNEGLFDHLGFDGRPTLDSFRARYEKDGELDFDKLMTDVWNYEPTATRWRAENESLGLTPESYLHSLLDLIADIQKTDPESPELQKAYELRDQVMAQNAIRKH